MITIIECSSYNVCYIHIFPNRVDFGGALEVGKPLEITTSRVPYVLKDVTFICRSSQGMSKELKTTDLEVRVRNEISQLASVVALKAMLFLFKLCRVILIISLKLFPMIVLDMM